MKYEKSLLATFFLLFSLNSVSVYANTFGFAADLNNEIGINSGYISQGYQGFNWTGSLDVTSNGRMYYRSWANDSYPSFNHWPSYNGTLGAAWSSGGADLYMTLSTPGTFTLNSLDIAVPWYGRVANVSISGWNNGNLVDSAQYIATSTYQTLNLGWSGLTELKITDGRTQNLILTNMNVTSIPVPSAIWLFGTGLLGFLGLKRHKQ
jgi:hypothetical protein